MKLEIAFPDKDSPKRMLSIQKERVRIGRDAGCDIVIDGKRFPKVSGLHAEFVFKRGQMWLVHRSKSNPTFLETKPVTDPVKIRTGQKIRLGHTGPVITVLATATEPQKTVLAGKSSDHLPPQATNSEPIEFDTDGVVGRGENATIRLDHPHVSRRHALLKREGDKVLISDLGSANGTFLDGVRILAKCELPIGGVIDIGPFSLLYDGQSLVRRTRKNNISLNTQDIHFLVKDKSTGKALHLLNGISLSVEPGEFVSILGPSGSGKSTLLKVLSGRSQPSSGCVTINNQDLHQRFQSLKEDIVVVPQTTQFHDSLTVRSVLGYSARLRLPLDIDIEERKEIVSSSIAKVELNSRSETSVRNLSGGQQKRLALANELISDPSLVFLDEVTSGLDEKADREIMQLLRDLAAAGKTVVCVTHNLGNVEACCHKVLVLTVGGRAAFFGKPSEALKYFGVKSLGEIYSLLSTRTPEQWCAKFLNEVSASSVLQIDKGSQTPQQPTASQSIVQRLGMRPISQTSVLASRYLEVWLQDPIALAATFGQAALVGILLCIAFYSIPDGPDQLLARRTELRNLLFLVGVSCFWLGANNAVKEIVKERKIYRRERDFNLFPESYWFSKAVVLSSFGLCQTSAIVASVVYFCEVPGVLTGYLAIGFLLSLVGTMLGLLISACSKSEELAVALIPIAIIPQIVLAGVVAQLNDTSRILAQLMTTSYWGQHAIEQILPEADRIETDMEIGISKAVTVLVVQLIAFAVAGVLRVRLGGANSD